MKMKQCPQNKFFSPLAEKVLPYQLKAELVAALVLGLAFFVRVDYSAITNVVFMVGFALLAMMYYILTFKQLPDGTPLKVCLTYRLLGVGQAVSCLGMQLLLINGNGAKVTAVAGALTLGIASLSLVLSRNMKTVDRDDTQVDVIRGFVLLAGVFGIMYL